MATGVADVDASLFGDGTRLGATGLGLAAAAPLGELERRICAAAIRLVGRWGVRKTTIADVAKEAGCGRATVYRAFPGGKRELLLAAGALELTTFLETMGELADRAPDTETVLVALISTAARTLARNEALQFLLHHEADLLLPVLGWGEQNHLYAHVSLVIGPHLEPFLGDQAAWAAEWAGRAVLSYLFNPSPHLDLGDEADARRVVRQFLLPALEPVGAAHPS
jgi:TetR/AcrR family transcriptional repressor of uid operon